MRSLTTSWLATVAEPLAARLGGELIVTREGDAVTWNFDGQSAVVELLADGRMRAIFVDRVAVDAVSRRPACAAYGVPSAYALTPASCDRMVTDLLDFFSGVREPRFTFVDALANSSARGTF